MLIIIIIIIIITIIIIIFLMEMGATNPNVSISPLYCFIFFLKSISKFDTLLSDHLSTNNDMINNNKILQQGENGKGLKKEQLASFTPSSKEPTHFPPHKAV